MANPLRGEVILRTASRPYTLSFSINAICELEDHLDLGINAIGERMNDPKKMRMSLVRALIWAGLRDHHPEVTLDQAGSIVGEVGIQPVTEHLVEAFKVAFPEMEGAGGAPSHPPKGKAGAG